MQDLLLLVRFQGIERRVGPGVDASEFVCTVMFVRCF